MNDTNEVALNASAQAEQRSGVSKGVGTRIKSWDGPTVVLTVFGLLLTSMTGVGGLLLINALNELRDSILALDNRILALDDRMESRFKYLEEKVAANGERLAHIDGHLGKSGDSSAHSPSGVTSSSNQRVPSKLLSVHFEALR